MPNKRGKKAAPRTNKRVKIPERMDELNKQLKQRGEHVVEGKHAKFARLDMKQVYQMAFAGFSDIELAQFFHVSVDQFRAWQNPDDKAYRPEIVEALFRGRDGAVTSVAHALYRRARGYKHKQQTYFVTDQGIVSKESIKQYPPDFASAAFILKNKRPQDWQDKQTLDMQGNATIQPVINVITDSDTIKRLTKLKDEKLKQNKSKKD